MKKNDQYLDAVQEFVTETENVEATSEEASVDNDGLDGGENFDGGMYP